MDLQAEVDKIHEHETESGKFWFKCFLTLFYPDVITAYKDVLYKTSSGQVGGTAHML